MYTYLLINIATVFFPLLFSFEKKMGFARLWKYLFPAMIVTGVVFIGWDILFTNRKIWEFNSNYILGFYFYNIPLEECLFFVTVPFACVFVYEVLRFYIKTDYFKKASLPLGWIVIFTLATFTFMHLQQLYTSVSSLAACVLLLWNQLLFRKGWLGYFWLTYLVCLIPFFIVNGTLTSLPVVIYSSTYNSDIRVGSIPVEDFIFQLDLMMLLITIYEKCKNYEKRQPFNLFKK
ncbi:MAG: lycopene cyclase domain-containing protein [Bacteroidia bacterium]|nr:lycopene cyclase domain-containing protein [Bacteroidia bacterium]